MDLIETKIAVLIPSRGLIHSRTMESIGRNLKGFSYETFYSHNRGIPEAFNFLAKEGLRDSKVTHLLFVEEDVVVPDEALKKALALEKEVVYIDYPVGEKNYSCVRKIGDQVLWGGMGCTLTERAVFGKVKEPWFYTEKSLDLDLNVVDTPYKYGGHDIWFGLKCGDAGIGKAVLEGVTCTHLRIPAMDQIRREDNIGFYEVVEKTCIDNYQTDGLNFREEVEKEQ